MADQIVLPVLEEELSVSKDMKVTGRVAVSTETYVSSNLLDVDLTSQAVEVTRIAIGQQVDIAPSVRTEGNVTIVPILEERAIVQKQLFLVEEIHIKKISSVEHVAVPVETRHQTVNVVRRTDLEPQTETDSSNG